MRIKKKVLFVTFVILAAFMSWQVNSFVKHESNSGLVPKVPAEFVVREKNGLLGLERAGEIPNKIRSQSVALNRKLQVSGTYKVDNRPFLGVVALVQVEENKSPKVLGVKKTNAHGEFEFSEFIDGVMDPKHRSILVGVSASATGIAHIVEPSDLRARITLKDRTGLAGIVLANELVSSGMSAKISWAENPANINRSSILGTRILLPKDVKRIGKIGEDLFGIRPRSKPQGGYDVIRLEQTQKANSGGEFHFSGLSSGSHFFRIIFDSKKTNSRIWVHPDCVDPECEDIQDPPFIVRNHVLEAAYVKLNVKGMPRDRSFLNYSRLEIDNHHISMTQGAPNQLLLPSGKRMILRFSLASHEIVSKEIGPLTPQESTVVNFDLRMLGQTRISIQFEETELLQKVGSLKISLSPTFEGLDVYDESIAQTHSKTEKHGANLVAKPKSISMSRIFINDEREITFAQPLPQGRWWIRIRFLSKGDWDLPIAKSFDSSFMVTVAHKAEIQAVVVPTNSLKVEILSPPDGLSLKMRLVDHATKSVFLGKEKFFGSIAPGQKHKKAIRFDGLVQGIFDIEFLESGHGKIWQSCGTVSIIGIGKNEMSFNWKQGTLSRIK